MAKVRAKKADVVRLTFLDHVEGADEPLEFFVYGRVFKSTRTHYVVDCWAYPNIDHEDRSDNINRFSILKKTISEVIVYQEPSDGG
jgi:hypothetical protein